MTHNSRHAPIGNPLMKPRAIVWDLFGDHLRYIDGGRVRTLAWHGFGPLAAATWISPHPRLEMVRDALAGLSATRIDLLESRALSRAADREMAFRCWDLDGLGRDYVELISGYEQLASVAG